MKKHLIIIPAFFFLFSGCDFLNQTTIRGKLDQPLTVQNINGIKTQFSAGELKIQLVKDEAGQGTHIFYSQGKTVVKTHSDAAYESFSASSLSAKQMNQAFSVAINSKINVNIETKKISKNISCTVTYATRPSDVPVFTPTCFFLTQQAHITGESNEKVRYFITYYTFIENKKAIASLEVKTRQVLEQLVILDNPDACISEHEISYYDNGANQLTFKGNHYIQYWDPVYFESTALDALTRHRLITHNEKGKYFYYSTDESAHRHHTLPTHIKLRSYDRTHKSCELN